jgi:serine phosphatase RsbU (regulator of sigma subunit)
MRRDVLTAPPDMKTSEALRLMAERRAGSIVIVGPSNKPIGIITERDLLYKVVLPGLDPARVPVLGVMTRKIVSLRAGDTVEAAYKAMLKGNFRHLIVIEKGCFAGIISIKDIIRFRGELLEQMVDEKTVELRKMSQQLTRSLGIQKREMTAAGNFQRALVAKKQPKIPGLRVSRAYQPELSIGGDFFEVARIGRGRAGILMADVMGHGITSAMIAIELKLKFEQYARDGLLPHTLAAHLNNALIPLMPDSYFVAGFYGVADFDAMKMNYIQFGLPSPTLFEAGTLRARPLLPANMPIGFRRHAQYKAGEIRVRPGDMLLLFTDGCTEQKNPKGKFLGERRFIRMFKEFVRSGENNIARKLYREVVRHAGGNPITDDIAILICEFTGK